MVEIFSKHKIILTLSVVGVIYLVKRFKDGESLDINNVLMLALMVYGGLVLGGIVSNKV